MNKVLRFAGIVDTETFWIGWKRRSAIILDSAGCPIWLNRWRCGRPPKGWGRLLTELTDRLDVGE
jgi:hypothetical protein